jgi:hypothetical protein
MSDIMEYKTNFNFGCNSQIHVNNFNLWDVDKMMQCFIKYKNNYPFVKMNKMKLTK